MAATPVQDLLTTSQVAEIIGRSVPTINRMALDGRLTVAHKLPGSRGAYLFTRREIDRFLREETVGAGRKAS